MTPLEPEFVENYPIKNELRMRGFESTRLEVFVDAQRFKGRAAP